MTPAANPAAPAAHTRRTYVVDRGFQVKYTLLLMALGATATLVFATMMYLAHVEAQRDLPIGPELRAQLAEGDTQLLLLILAIVVLMAGALGLIGVLITHRVAGPIHVMSRYVSALARGRYPAMRPLRRHDELKHFFDRFQQAVDAMRIREAEEAQRIDAALAALSAVSGDAAIAALADLKSMADRKREATAAEPGKS